MVNPVAFLLIWWLIGVISTVVTVVLGELREREAAPYRVKDLFFMWCMGLLGPVMVVIGSCVLWDLFAKDIGNIIIWDPRKKKD